MTKKTRRIMFYVFLFLFLVMATSVVFYAQGYIFDWKNKKIIPSGAFYFKSLPEKADIYINEKYYGKTNKFIKRLLPGTYYVKINKPNYWEWQKSLEIKSKLVTEVKNVLLIPKELSLEQTTKFNVKYCSISNNQEKLLYLTDKSVKEVNPITQKIADPARIPTVSRYALRVLNLLENNDVQVYPFIEKTILQENIPSLKNLSDIIWAKDDKKVILNIERSNFYFLDLKDDFRVINLKNLIWTLSNYKIYNPRNLLFNPQNSNEIFFIADQNLYLLKLNLTNLTSSVLEGPIISNVLSYKIINNNIYFVSSFPLKSFYRANQNLSSFVKLFDIPFLGLKEDNVSIVNEDILMIEDSLYLYDDQTREIKKIADKVVKTEISSDKEKLFWQTPKEIGIIWLVPVSAKQPLREKNQIIFPVKTFKKIKDAVWYPETNEHIIFIVDNELRIVEIDDRDKINSMLIQSFVESEDLPKKLFYSKKSQSLYVLTTKDKLLEINLKIDK